MDPTPIPSPSCNSNSTSPVCAGIRKIGERIPRLDTKLEKANTLKERVRAHVKSNTGAWTNILILLTPMLLENTNKPTILENFGLPYLLLLMLLAQNL